ncbi:MAG TPA: hypothetical protein VGJ44_00565 [Kribbellaceae bacterium]
MPYSTRPHGRRATEIRGRSASLAGCSGDEPDAAGNLCDLVRDGELPAGEHAAEGFPKPSDPGEDEGCRWETDKGSSLDLAVWKWLRAETLGEQWKVRPRRLGGRDVYVHPSA